MKLQIVLTAILFLAGCHINKENSMEKENNYSFYVGTYTKGESEGIYKYLLNEDGSLQQIGLAAISSNPSFLAMSADRKYMVAVSEINNTDTLTSFQIIEDSLVFISQSKSGGAHPCFVAVNEDGFVLSANYTGGNVALHKLNEEGDLTELLDLEQHTGSGITKRQEVPHAHSVWFAPSGNEIISVDLGTNELWFSQLDPKQEKLLPSDPQTLKMEPGAGPRHLVFHPNKKWIYVVNELNSTVSLVKKSKDGYYELTNSASTLPVDYSEPNTCADIHISSDGEFVYASNRGHNSIAIFDVNDKDGSLRLIGHEKTLGDSPRNFSLSPDENYVIVANQRTNNIVSFQRDNETGLLNYISQTDAPTPVCILF